MVDSVQGSGRPNRFYNKYVEYRKQYDRSKSNFDTALSSKETSPEKTKTETSAPEKKLADASTSNTSKDSAPKKNLAAMNAPVVTDAGTAQAPAHQPATYGSYNQKAPVLEDTSASATMGASAPSNVSVPNLGSASNRMMDKVKEYEPHILAAAARYNIDPNWIAGVIWQESRGNPRAVSHCGAMGLMQLMPGTARHLGVSNAFDIGQNIDGGAKYLRQMLDTFGGNMSFATAAYNAGPGNVMKHGGIPPFRETQGYVPHVLGYANSFRTAAAFQDQGQNTAIRV